MSEQAPDSSPRVYNILLSAKTTYFPRLLKHEIVQQQAQRTFDGKSDESNRDLLHLGINLKYLQQVVPSCPTTTARPACKYPYVRRVHFRST